MRHALIVAGPTCSGKSGLAMELAGRLGGTVVNADAMQVFAELRVLTARPSEADEALVPHALYGICGATEPTSVAWWRERALAAMEAAPGTPILTGGTFLYLESLTRGLSAMPAIPDHIRAEARAAVETEGPAAMHAKLDPETAATLRPTDPQRIARAWEVFWATGRTLRSWQDEKPVPAPGWTFSAILLDPPREKLRAAIAARLTAMLGGGALEEVAGLLARGLDPALPAMRAHGVTEFAAHLRGEATLEEATRRTSLVTGQYTKRQSTWMRHRPPVADPTLTHTIHARHEGLAQYSDQDWAEIIRFAKSVVDPGRPMP